jgi:hypothetical protein
VFRAGTVAQPGQQSRGQWKGNIPKEREGGREEETEREMRSR